MSNLLEQYNTYQENKEYYSIEERSIIRKELLKECERKIIKHK